MADFSANPRPAPTTVVGVRGVDDNNSVNVVADVDSELHMWMPSGNPLFTMTKAFRKTRTASQYRYDILTKDEHPFSATVNTTTTAVATSVVLESGHGNRVYTSGLYKNVQTDEVVRVSAVSTDTLTIRRGIGGTAAAALTAGDKLLFIGSAFEDGSGKGRLLSVAEANNYNYTQIFKTAYGMTGRQQHTKLYTGRDLPQQRLEAGITHAKAIEYSAFFGVRESFSGTDQLVTTTGGVDYFLASNIWNLNGTVPSERSFIEFLEEAMKWGGGGNLNGSGTKTLFCSSRWLTEINFWAHDRLEIRQDESTLGIEIAKYRSPHGTVNLVRAAILDYEYPDRAYLIDINEIRQVKHEGRGNTKIVRDIQNVDADSYEEQLLTDMGWEVTLEGSHALLKGLSV